MKKSVCKKRGKMTACAFTVLCLGLSGAAVIGNYTPWAVSCAATHQQEISDSKQKIEDNKKKIEELKDKKEDINDKLDELAKLKSDAAAYIAKLDDELSSLNAQITDMQNQIEAVKQEITVTQGELEEAKRTETEQYQSMKLRIKFMYERGNKTMLDTMFKSGSFADMLNKAEYVTNVSDYDRKKLIEYEETRQAVAEKEEELQSEQGVLEESAAKLEEQKESVEKLQSDKQQELKNYNAKIAAAEADVTALNSDIASIQAAIKQEENNIAAIEAKIKKEEEEARKKAEAAGKQYTMKSIGDIKFTWPCPSSGRITSSFGDRESPTEGASTNHKGIDIGASSGSAVVAAADGTVVISTYSASAGNYIMISHGGGVYTVYMHMSSLGVSSGATVKRGQQIGAVGSTGYSTGPHLHFGLRINGSYVNPRSYVSP